MNFKISSLLDSKYEVRTKALRPEFSLRNLTVPVFKNHLVINQRENSNQNIISWA